MQVRRVWGADICRDGGSYSLCFDSNDGRWYELFLKARAFEGAGPSHDAPVIYLGSVNDGHVVRSLSWQEGRAFVDPLSFEGSRFQELRRLIETEGGARVDSQSSWP